jgi:SAM-dependent methyltransferase
MANAETPRVGGQPTRHLDLGCGSRPRNPYHRDELHGVDLVASAPAGAPQVRRANLAVEPIPYGDDTFDSVSAYDFLEHIPRILPTADGRSTRFPFVELMNEMWRVLKPGGLLYASTPCYPYPEAFQDPTHVNVLTLDSHEYFTQPGLTARMYGFVGTFEVVRVARYSPSSEYEPIEARWRHRLRTWNRVRRGGRSHVLWEFVAVK